MKKSILISLLSFFLTACSGSSFSMNTTNAALPPEPDRTANNAILAGIDSDGDGVRDDVQRLVFRSYTSTKKRTLSLALAKEVRKIYATPPTTRAEARAIADAENRVSDCIYSRREMDFNSRGGLNEQIVAAHTDTRERMKTYRAYNSLLHGELFYLHDSDPDICKGILP